METNIIEVMGKAAGIGGISLGVFLILMREIIRKDIFPTLNKNHAFSVIRLLIFVTFIVTIVGVIAWAYVTNSQQSTAAVPTSADLSLSFDDGNSTTYTYSQQGSPFVPVQSLSVTPSHSKKFRDNTPFREPVENTEALVPINLFIFNNGETDAKKVWFKLFITKDIKALAMGAEEYANINSGYNKTMDVNEIYFTQLDGQVARGKEITTIDPSFLLLGFPGANKTYTISYSIGADNIKTTERTLSINVVNSEIPYAYKENFRGLELLKSEKYPEAAKAFSNALSHEPSNSAFNYNICTAYLLDSQPSKAEKHCLIALQAEGNLYFISGQLAAINIQLGRFKQGLKYALDALDDKPNSVGDLQNLNAALLKLDANGRMTFVDELQQRERENLLLFSSFLGDYLLTKRLIAKYKICVNVATKLGTTPLHHAVGRGETEIAKLLLESGADVQIKDSSGETPISLAKKKTGNSELIKLLEARISLPNKNT